MKTEITQTVYGKIIVDTSEHAVQIWQRDELIIIERDKIQELIDILEHEKI